VTPIPDPLAKLDQLRGVYFDWGKEHGGQHDVGMIAEEVGKILPEIVSFEDNGVDASGMDYSKLTPLLVEAVKALRAEYIAEVAALRTKKDTQIADLQSQASALRAVNDELSSRLATLEKTVERLAVTNAETD
jgi:hypothetical protein